MSVYREKILGSVEKSLFKNAATDFDHDVFLSLTNTPVGPQPTAIILIATANPLLGQPPLMLAMPLSVVEATDEEIHDGVTKMVEHLANQRAELLAAK